MRYNITYRAQRRKAARLDAKLLAKNGGPKMSFVQYWTQHGERYVGEYDAAGKPTEKRRLGITAKQAKTKSYTSNGAREVARRLKRLNKEKE